MDKMDHADNAEQGRTREYRDITQRYCAHVDDNVIVVRNSNRNADEYECLSAHLCRNKDCKRRGCPSESGAEG